MTQSIWSVTAVLLAACGGGDDSVEMPDAPPRPMYEYDLSCFRVMPPTPPAMVEIKGWLAHLTSPTLGSEVPNTEVRVESIDGTSVLSSSTSDLGGIFTIALTTGGGLTPVRLAYEPTTTDYNGNTYFAKQRWYSARAPWRSTVGDGDFAFFGAQRVRTNNIASSLGQTLDNTKGVVEVWVIDCSNRAMTGVTVAMVEHPDARWAHYTGNGLWVENTTTLSPAKDITESMTATVNVDPGMKQVTVSAGATTIGTIAILVEPDSFNRVLMLPGYAPGGPGF